MWIASYVIALANATGWEEEHIIWRLPLSRGLQYHHAVLCINGVKTTPIAGKLEEEIADIKSKMNLKDIFDSWQPPT